MAESVKLNVGVKGNFTELDSQIKAYDGKKTITVKTALSGGGTKEVTKYNTALGETVSVTEKFNKSGTSTGAVISRISNNSSAASTKIGQLGKDFLDTTGKVLKFGASTAIIGLFTAACGLAVSAIKEFDDSLTNFKKVSDLSGDSLTQYTVKLGELGAEVARTRTEMVENATIFKQAGYSDDDAAMLSKVSSLYQNVADAEVSASDAGAFVVSQMKAWKLSANEAEGAVDQVNEV